MTIAPDLVVVVLGVLLANGAGWLLRGAWVRLVARRRWAAYRRAVLRNDWFDPEINPLGRQTVDQRRIALEIRHEIVAWIAGHLRRRDSGRNLPRGLGGQNRGRDLCSVSHANRSLVGWHYPG
jgi:hypothetical protein